MDDLDRMFRRLVQNIRNGYPEYLSQPFEVSELFQSLIPYRHNRKELEIDTNEDYEIALCQMLAGERQLMMGDDVMRETHPRGARVQQSEHRHLPRVRRVARSARRRRHPPGRCAGRTDGHESAAARERRGFDTEGGATPAAAATSARKFSQRPSSSARRTLVGPHASAHAIATRPTPQHAHGESARRRLPLLRRRAARRPPRRLLSELRAEPRDPALPRVRLGARSELEILRHLRTQRRRRPVTSQRRVAVIAGDGIGPEVTREALKVLAAVEKKFKPGLTIEQLPYGADHYLKTGVTIAPAEMQRLGRDFDAIIVGALGDPRVPGNEHARDILLGMRFQLDLYVNERPARLLHERLTPLKGKTPKDIDLVIFRENTEGLYVSVGGIFKKGTPDEIAIAEELNTRKGVERIIRYAFAWAKEHGKTRVAMADKANAIEAHSLWRRVFEEVGKEYPGITRETRYVDAMAMDLVRAPEQFQVIVTGNLFGDILSDIASMIAGGLGMAPSANRNPGPHRDVRARARQRAAHGRQGRREPNGRDPDTRDAPRDPRRRRRRARRGEGRGRRDQCGYRHVRCRRHDGHKAVGDWIASRI